MIKGSEFSPREKRIRSFCCRPAKGTQPLGVKTGCSPVARSGSERPAAERRKLWAFRLPALVTIAGAVLPSRSERDQRASPRRISSTGFVDPSFSKIGVPAGWQSQLQPVVAMLKIFDPGR